MNDCQIQEKPLSPPRTLSASYHFSLPCLGTVWDLKQSLIRFATLLSGALYILDECIPTTIDSFYNVRVGVSTLVIFLSLLNAA